MMSLLNLAACELCDETKITGELKLASQGGK